MLFKSHLIVATGAFAVCVAHTQSTLLKEPLKLVIFYLATMMGCCLPDIDHPSSTIGRRLLFVSYPIRLVFGHRGITHSLLAIGILFGLNVYLDSELLWWFAFGYALHIVGDYLTDAGIPALYPSKKRYRFVIVGSTGGLSEYVMVLLFLVACVFSLRF